MSKIMECVPNFSEGRDRQIVEKIVDCFRGKERGLSCWITAVMKTITAR